MLLVSTSLRKGYGNDWQVSNEEDWQDWLMKAAEIDCGVKSLGRHWSFEWC
jgi:hypothetical protein